LNVPPAEKARSQGAAPGPVLQPHQFRVAVTVTGWFALCSPLPDGSAAHYHNLEYSTVTFRRR
jgi:hypothetical protein